jgi:hypothetical protein
MNRFNPIPLHGDLEKIGQVKQPSGITQILDGIIFCIYQ